MAAKRKSGGRRYGKAAQKKVGKVMHERKQGKLRSGGSGRKVTSRKQAIAIGLSEARASGAKVPEAPAKRKKKAATKKRATKKTAGRKTATKKRATKKTTGKRATKKTPGKKRATKKRATKKTGRS
jgi:hypothetical protein